MIAMEPGGPSGGRRWTAAEVQEMAESLGLDARALSDGVGIAPASVERWLRGKARPSSSSWRKLEAFAAASGYGGRPLVLARRPWTQARLQALIEDVGYSYGELARRIGASPDAVRGWVEKARPVSGVLSENLDALEARVCLLGHLLPLDDQQDGIEDLLGATRAVRERHEEKGAVPSSAAVLLASIARARTAEYEQEAIEERSGIIGLIDRIRAGLLKSRRGLRDVFCGCCLQHAADLRRDKNGAPFTICSVCGSRCFIRGAGGLRGVRHVTREIAASLLESLEPDERVDQWLAGDPE